MLRWIIQLACVAMIIVGSSVASWAHSAPPATLGSLTVLAPPPAVPPGASAQPLLPALRSVTLAAMTLVIIGLGLAGAALPTSRGRGRYLLAFGISLLLVVIGVAAAVHSVHHLGDSQGAGRCALAASAENVSGIDTEGTLPTAIAAVTVDRAYANPSEGVSDASLAPAHGRAPPA